jgi:hypothetical protein
MKSGNNGGRRIRINFNNKKESNFLTFFSNEGLNKKMKIFYKYLTLLILAFFLIGGKIALADNRNLDNDGINTFSSNNIQEVSKKKQIKDKKKDDDWFSRPPYRKPPYANKELKSYQDGKAGIDIFGRIWPDNIDRNPDGSFAYDLTNPEETILAYTEALRNSDNELMNWVLSERRKGIIRKRFKVKEGEEAEWLLKNSPLTGKDFEYDLRHGGILKKNGKNQYYFNFRALSLPHTTGELQHTIESTTNSLTEENGEWKY